MHAQFEKKNHGVEVYEGCAGVFQGSEAYFWKHYYVNL